jgi:flavin reductase (DIM6/NTAB) family NADH-FMN oxidoreductase RutF
MIVDFSTLPARDVYGWMTATIMPRPIAWVSTISREGRTNLAPFSFFQGITSNPPTLMFVPVNTRSGEKKDTLKNIEQTREFVVSLVSYELAEKMNATAALLPYGDSEFEAFGIDAAPSSRVRPPRVAAAPASFECTLHSVVRIGDGPLAGNVVFGRIHIVHVNDEVIGPDGRPDPSRLDLVGRMSGELYTRTTERFSLTRPDR